eukprot:CAMPEP_0113457786 /NCGR_PEP_ID=MMETSP0014_2-20120614/9588_1 /TAXON_ID=2857 /ORGANISM="Nitzschia sp." /LENGTH=288 /DNA_ID=CAMNT_0000349293 /DNA_START=26 /DNA_END=892 /DNA_ORIENTATION=- /assembly_acc=CAM_ASM_000159
MSKVLQQSLSALKGPEWDSSDEEGETQPTTAVSKTKNTESKTKKGKKATKGSKKAKNNNKAADEKEGEEEKEEDLVLYIGHLPKEMEERDLRQFLSQFGNVLNCRVARKISSGQPKGYAFVRFEDVEVLKIAQDTLHGYFLGVGNTQRLVCQIRPAYRGMFFSNEEAIRTYKEQRQTERKDREIKLSNPDNLKLMTTSLIKQEAKKRAKLAALGIEYDFPGYGGSASSAATADDSKDEGNNDKNENTSENKKRKNSVGSQESSGGGSAQKAKKSRKSKEDKNRRKSAP